MLERFKSVRLALNVWWGLWRVYLCFVQIIPVVNQNVLDVFEHLMSFFNKKRSWRNTFPFLNVSEKVLSWFWYCNFGITVKIIKSQSPFSGCSGAFTTGSFPADVAVVLSWIFNIFLKQFKDKHGDWASAKDCRILSSLREICDPFCCQVLLALFLTVENMKVTGNELREGDGRGLWMHSDCILYPKAARTNLFKAEIIT